MLTVFVLRKLKIEPNTYEIKTNGSELMSFRKGKQSLLH
jgi:hypothetical protein